MGVAESAGTWVGSALQSFGITTPQRMALVWNQLMGQGDQAAPAAPPAAPNGVPLSPQQMAMTNFNGISAPPGYEGPDNPKGDFGTLGAGWRAGLMAVGVKLLFNLVGLGGKNSDISPGGLMKTFAIGAAGGALSDMVNGRSHWWTPLLNGAASGAALEMEMLGGGDPGWGGAAVGALAPTVGHGLKNFFGNFLSALPGMGSNGPAVNPMLLGAT